MDPEKTSMFLEKHAWIQERHACFWKNKHGSGKDKHVSGKTRMDPGKTCVFSGKTSMDPGKTCVFLEKHAWIRERHACLWKNKHGSRKDMRVSEKPRLHPKKPNVSQENKLRKIEASGR
jgi:hypothetical protein